MIHTLNTSARRAFVLLALAAATGAAFAQKAPAAAANWPTKPVRILVGFPAGSTPDLVARTISEPLSRALGQPVIVDNKPGAGGNIAADMVAKATDNHTIGVLINGNMTIAKLLNPATPFDPQKDLAPISLIGTAPLLLTAPADAPGKDAQEFFLAARNAGTKWSYGTPGIGTVGHIGMELLKSKTNIDPVHVPYPGNPQVINAMLGGQVHLSLLPPGLAGPQIRAGKLKAIGVTSSGRSALVPEYPSLDEQGVRGFQLEIWTAAAAPKSLPRPVVDKLSRLIAEIVRTPEVRQKLFQQGWQVAGTSPEGLANRVRQETALLGGVIAMRGIKAQ
ncbi:Bug family tripartite tricarboxylate transporter substrate binding protein [Ramlibacter montanisoli]|uniref:Tripartite tricarboxylate transporter substrate binding protein n=1 Tax=Ramlibacter montanisoli TaxID=2732512 RepID=A0A849K668_9BURK|nr:tripartite tricarboxylate transporter substrate binding protein [Ramlibacter montanisoli]NNU43070.1 tripartite tricarboxylate transporter substrate binding protein [Ramlibacter montanisoli]